MPQRGLVEDEVTNTIDWFRILAHLGECELDAENAAELDAVLPRCFGGNGREYTISNSLTPDQTYKLCIRTMEYEFRLETKHNVTYDGKVDMDSFTYELFQRDAHHTKISDNQIRDYFIAIARDYTKNIRI